MLFNPADVTLWKHLVNAFFLDLLVSVDDDNSPQWRKLAWSQDCSMLACSYRFVMYWVDQFAYLHVCKAVRTSSIF